MELLIMSVLLFNSANGIVNGNAASKESTSIPSVFNLMLSKFPRKTSQYYISTRSFQRETSIEFADIVNEIVSRERNLKVQIDNEYKSTTELDHQLVNVLLVDSFESFLDLDPASETVNYTVSEYYLIYYSGSNQITDLINIFQYFLDNYIPNVNIIISHPNNVIDVYTYFLFSEQNCRHPKIKLLDRLSNGKWANNASNFYPDKVQNMHSCPVRAALWNMVPFVILPIAINRNMYRGFDTEILMSFATYLNFSVDVRIPPDGDDRGIVYPNFTTTGALKMLQEKSADLSIGYLRLIYNRAIVALPSKPYFQSNIIFVVLKNEDLYSSLEILAFPFTPGSWIAVITYYVLGLLLVFVSRHSQTTKHFIFGSTDTPALNMTASFLGQVVVSLPKLTFARFLLMVWILATLVIRCAYQSQLFHLLRTTLIKKPPQTLSELESRDYKIVITKFVHESMSNMTFGNNGPMPTIVLSSKDYFRPLEYMEENSHQKLAVVVPREFIDYYINVKHKQGTFHILRESVITMHGTVYMSKHSFLLEPFNRFVTHLIEHGLIGLWIEEGMQAIGRKIHIQTEHLITLGDLVGIYIICGGMLVIAGIVFLAEVFFGKRSNARKDIFN